MSEEKCFCHFMGYKVKDSTAQRLIEENKDNVFEKHNGERLKFWVGTEEEYQALDIKENNCLYITTNDTVQNFLDELGNSLDESISEMEKYYKRFKKTLFETSSHTYTNNQTIPVNIEDYTLFAITLRNANAQSVLYCSLTEHDTWGADISGFNTTLTNSGTDMYFRFVGKPTAEGILVQKSNFSETPGFVTDENGLGVGLMYVTKIVGIM